MFRPNLTDQEIMPGFIRRASATETYQEYADRLMQMADGLMGGTTNAANVQHALGTFLRLARPQRKNIVQAHVRGKRGAPGSILNEAVGFLCELAQSNGRLGDYKCRKLLTGPVQRTPTAKQEVLTQSLTALSRSLRHTARKRTWQSSNERENLPKCLDVAVSCVISAQKKTTPPGTTAST